MSYARTVTGWARRHPAWATFVGVLVVLVIAGALDRPPEETKTQTASREPAKPKVEEPASRFKGRAADIEAVFLDELGDDAPGDLPRVEEVNRIERGMWAVFYNPDELAFGEDEVVRELRPVMNRLLNIVGLDEVTVIPKTELVTVGGQHKRGPLFVLTCDQSDNAQISWANVDEDGVKQICDYALRVTK